MSGFDPKRTLAGPKSRSAAIIRYRMPKQDSEQFRFVPRTLWLDSETLLLRPSRVITFEPMGEKHGSSPGLFYFAAAVPMVGFMHGAADLNPVDEAAPDGNVEITDRRRGIPFLHRPTFWLAA